MPETHLVDPPKQADSKVSFAGPQLKQAAPKYPFIGAVARVYWMFVGNAVLYLVALAVAQQRGERAWTTNAAFWAAVASLVLVRYVDIARLGGATASGDRASLSDWYRYVGWLLLLASVVWIIAHAVAVIGL